MKHYLFEEGELIYSRLGLLPCRWSFEVPINHTSLIASWCSFWHEIFHILLAKGGIKDYVYDSKSFGLLEWFKSLSSSDTYCDVFFGVFACPINQKVWLESSEFSIHLTGVITILLDVKCLISKFWASSDIERAIIKDIFQAVACLVIQWISW